MRFVSTMPLDGTRTIVHLKADGFNVRYRFISIEKTRWVDNGGFPVKGRDDIIVVPIGVESDLTEEVVKYELSKLFGCKPEDIEISISLGVRGRVRTTHSRRYSHGQDPDLPPRGWVQD